MRRSRQGPCKDPTEFKESQKAPSKVRLVRPPLARLRHSDSVGVYAGTASVFGVGSSRTLRWSCRLCVPFIVEPVRWKVG